MGQTWMGLTECDGHYITLPSALLCGKMKSSSEYYYLPSALYIKINYLLIMDDD